MSKLAKLKFSYTWLIVITVPVFLVAMFVFRSSSAIQFKAILILVTVYLIGAIVHHWQDKSLTLEMLLEYVLIAGLVLLILQGLMIT